MIVRTKADVRVVDWGNGTSHRFLLAEDKMGFTLCHTVVYAGTKSLLQYQRHLEACYCIAGRGIISNANGSIYRDIEPGLMYALNEHDPHFLIAGPDTDVELISVFNPPLQGDERHTLNPDAFSQY